MSADGSSEGALAGALMDVLADGEYWREYAVAAGASAPSSVLAQRAVDLYRRVEEFIEHCLDLDLDPDPEAPVSRAVSVVLEIADWGVLASYGRAGTGEGWIAPRSAFEWLIRVEGVDRWANEYGYPLPIDEQSDLPDEAWPTIGPDERDAEIGDFLEWWEVASARYAWVLAHAEESHFRYWALSAHVEAWRENVAAVIDGLHPWASFARRNGETELQSLVGIALLMTRGVFVTGWEWPQDGMVSPSRELVSQMLRETGALEWLSEHGTDPPEWLA